MRTGLRAIQRRAGITFIYITHDQGEALTMSDRVAVMSDGVIDQFNDSTTIYDHPETAFVASFENYNTTIFTIVSDSTLTAVLANKVRYGIDSSISSFAVIIVVVTLVGAILYEFMRRRAARDRARP